MLTFVLRVSTDAPADLAPAVRKEVAALDPELPLKDMASMAAVVSGLLAQPKLVSTLLGGFALLAAVLALVGVNGLTAYTISRQRHELGVRLAMGASPASLARMILARAGVLAGAGIGFGILGAVGLTRFLTSMLFQVAPTDPGVIAVTCAAVLVAALAACVAPARTAARVDPIETLRAL
jgi:putative ABC transport system permease protein